MVLPVLPSDVQALSACTMRAVVYLTVLVIHCENLARAHISHTGF